MANTVYDQLVMWDLSSADKPSVLVPGLATSWSTDAKDRTKWTFKLRPGVKFQTTDYFTPTRDFNADDVVFSFKRQWDANDPWHAVSGASYEYFESMGMPGLIKSIEKVDDYTVKFNLAAPMIAFPESLGDYPALITHRGFGTAYSAMQLVFVPYWGQLSDRRGRRPILVGSAAASVLATTDPHANITH